MFTQTVEYALRAMVYLASMAPGEVQSAGRIADAVEVPPKYLSKVLRGLVVARLVDSTRGPNGGFVLRGRADQITMQDIVEAVGAARRREDRSVGQGEPPGRNADARWRGAMGSVEHALRTTTLAGMLHAQRGNAGRDPQRGG